MIQIFTCPSCAAEITFQSGISVSCVCPYCRSLLVRHDRHVEDFGRMAEVPEDISPFRIGTAGRFDQIPFTLIGRMKMGWQDGSWNEWFLYSEDGRKGWLAEAQGFLAVSFEVEGETKERTLQALQEGTAHLSVNRALGRPLNAFPLCSYIMIEDRRFQIADVKEAECIGAEGELPFATPKGRKTTAIDLLGQDGEFAGIEQDASGTSKIYMGRYVEFDDLHFTDLRELPGWEMKRPARKLPQPAKGKTNAGW